MTWVRKGVYTSYTFGKIINTEIVDDQDLSDSLSEVSAKETQLGNFPAALKNTENIEEIITKFKRISFNAVGEGLINICGEGGDIEGGDLIVTSSIIGKGMKQKDDIVRGCTVAKSRETVSFSNATEVKKIACVYLCG